ncbi:MAG: ABC transporter permease [Saprospiraceae bacterium]|jgi:ABC-2 type transport system permease protein|nr:ABC transporter permease [Saprospiraceae bacterium]
MNKIWLVTKREYLTRVKNKTFILTTLLTPIGFLLFFVVLGFIMSRGSDKVKTIAVSDPSGLMDGAIESKKNLVYQFSDESIDILKEKYLKGEINGIVEVLPIDDPNIRKYKFKYHSDDQLGMEESVSIESAVSKRIRNYKLKKADIDESTLANLDTDVTMDPFTIKKEKKISSLTTIVSSIIGGVVGYAMFFIIVLYGSQVMRSVMEEKINRIIEVLISSVKPFELMMGKVLGVGLVGLTQIGIWMILLPLIFIVGTAFFGLDAGNMAAMNTGGVGMDEMATAQDKIFAVIAEIKLMNWYKILPITLFYFFGGYFAYSALFAAVGSAVGEDINEAQSLTLPVMMPLILAVYIGFSAVNAPDSSLAVWASMIPLLSSIVMPVRLPFDPPWWQIVVSMVSLVIFVILLVGLAGRIYRVGILMYGKKASFKELSRWIFYKG